MYTHTLLLVDDSTTIQHEIRLALADEPIEVIVAVNGHRALDHIEAARPDIVLASTTALGVNGYGLAHYVSQRPYLSNVAVLLLTGSIGPADTHRMKESGARGFICHPLEPGSVVARVNEVLMLAAPEDGQTDVLGQLATAFDAIDASMTSNVFGGRARPNEIAITPEALARIVNDAVTQAIAAYEQARTLTPAPATDSSLGGQRPSVAPPTSRQTTQEQLQRDMGIDEIEFELAPAPAADSLGYQVLAAQMGVGDFSFEDHESTRQVEASEPLGVASDTLTAPPAVTPETAGPVEKSGASVTSVLEPLRHAVVLLGTALADQPSRFRSTLAERRRRGEEERAEKVSVAEPTPPPVLAPAPAEQAPAPGDPVPAPKAARPPLERLKAMTPEEAARAVFFTFDPLPPIPPPIPREPRED